MAKITPRKAVRLFCLQCCKGSAPEVKECGAADCIFYLFRMGKGRIKVKQIRKKCFDCDGEGRKNIEICEFKDCPVYSYRFGKIPGRKGNNAKGNPEGLKKARSNTLLANKTISKERCNG